MLYHWATRTQDFNPAFETVDHNILLQRLENWVGLSGTVQKWFRSYLEGRGYYVSIGEHKSQWTSMTCGVPQGSILALLLFSLYMLPLSQIMRKNQLAYFSYTDDTQIYQTLSANDYSPIDSLCQCIDEINSWMCQNFLQLNKEKTYSVTIVTSVPWDTERVLRLVKTHMGKCLFSPELKSYLHLHLCI